MKNWGISALLIVVVFLVGVVGYNVLDDKIDKGDERLSQEFVALKDSVEDGFASIDESLKEIAEDREVVENGPPQISQCTPQPPQVLVIQLPQLQSWPYYLEQRGYCRSSFYSAWFADGSYKFKVETAQSFRLYIDGRLIMEKQASRLRTYSRTFYLTQGCHEIEVRWPQGYPEPSLIFYRHY